MQNILTPLIIIFLMASYAVAQKYEGTWCISTISRHVRFDAQFEKMQAFHELSETSGDKSRFDSLEAYYQKVESINKANSSKYRKEITRFFGGKVSRVAMDSMGSVVLDSLKISGIKQYCLEFDDDKIIIFNDSAYSVSKYSLVDNIKNRINVACDKERFWDISLNDSLTISEDGLRVYKKSNNRRQLSMIQKIMGTCKDFDSIIK